MDEIITAVVQKVCIKGKHGPYAVAKSDNLEGSITFALTKDVWQEKTYPTKGEMVLLSDVRKKRAGWRAMSSRFVRPSDEGAQQIAKK